MNDDSFYFDCMCGAKTELKCGGSHDTWVGVCECGVKVEVKENTFIKVTYDLFQMQGLNESAESFEKRKLNFEPIVIDVNEIDEPELDEHCPNCGEDYDGVDYEYQICHHCDFNNNNKNEPN